jgi:hypothetical protein
MYVVSTDSYKLASKICKNDNDEADTWTPEDAAKRLYDLRGKQLTIG